MSRESYDTGCQPGGHDAGGGDISMTSSDRQTGVNTRDGHDTVVVREEGKEATLQATHSNAHARLAPLRAL